METDELQQMLNELCADLFVERAAAADACAILHSLATLAQTFPAAQRVLGRSLAAPPCHVGSNSSNASALDSRVPVTSAPTLAALAKRFLYARETASGAIALLAALARANPRNQQRIVHSVAGVIVTRSLPQDEQRATVFDAGKIKKRTAKHRDARHVQLYVLTVPDSVKHEFRKWRQRQRALQHHRLPSGVPPAHGGVPQPCLCNDCLGLEQFLPTWRLHFEDLARWRIDGDDEQRVDPTAQPQTGDIAYSERPTLSTSAFLQVFLDDFQLCEHHTGVSSNDTLPSVAAAATNEQQLRDSKGTSSGGTVFYFVRTDVQTTTDPKPLPPPTFDPLLHICALALSPTVATVAQPTRPLRSPSSSSSSSSSNSSSSADCNKQLLTGNATAFAAVENRVLLFEGRTDIMRCNHQRDTPATHTSSTALACGARIARFVQRVVAFDKSASMTRSRLDDALMELLSDDDSTSESASDLQPLDRDVLASVLRFLHSSDEVAVDTLVQIVTAQQRPSVSHVSQDDDNGVNSSEAAATLPDTSRCNGDHTLRNATVSIVACVATQTLTVRCSSAVESDDNDTIDDTLRTVVFAATIPRARLGLQLHGAADALALLCASDDELQMLVARCRVCDCSDALTLDDAEDGDKDIETDAFVLRRLLLPPLDTPDLDVASSDTDYIDDEQQQQASARASPSTLSTHTVVPGLSPSLATALTRLNALVRQAASATTTRSALATKFAAALSSLIQRCDARIRVLASGGSSNNSSDAHRRAGIERCRCCRDLLLQLGKRVRLVLAPSLSAGAFTSVAADALSADALARVEQLVHRAVTRVQAESAAVSAWETPDARVERLALSRHVWASGCPDPEFFREHDARAAANAAAQRTLTRRLVAQQRARVAQQRARVDVATRKR